MPAVIEWLPFPKGWRHTIGLVRWPILAVLMMLGLGVIYRFAPARRNPCWHLFSPGTIVAATGWLAVSAGFSYYVANFSSYDKTYGSLGTVVVLMMWLYLSSYIVLVGAELNSEIEQARTGKEEDLDPGAAERPLTTTYADLCSCSRGISSTKLHGRKRLSSWCTRMSCHASRQALGDPGSANR